MLQVQIDATESVAQRVERVLTWTGEAAGSAELLILPELWPSGAFDVELGIESAQPLDGPLVGSLGELARENQTWIHGGSFIEAAPDGRYYNTAVLFNADGDLVASYRKIHLFGFDIGEAAALSPGTDVVVVDTPLGRTGLATCYDLRFPELFRAFVDQGATCVLLASGWPAARISRWNMLASARACENQMWIVGCNETGNHGGHQLGGHSLIADPWGDLLVADDTVDELAIEADLDPTEPAKVRASFPVLRDRRL